MYPVYRYVQYICQCASANFNSFFFFNILNLIIGNTFLQSHFCYFFLYIVLQNKTQASY